MARSDQFTVGIDFGTLSGRAVVVRVSDGAEVGSAVHDYAHGVLDTRLPASGTTLPPDWALQVPGDYRRGAAARRTCSGLVGRCRPGGCHRHRDRLHRLHGAAGAG